MHSTEPVFRGGCDWVSERGLPVRELQDEGVVFVVHNICELAVDDACAFVEVWVMMTRLCWNGRNCWTSFLIGMEETGVFS